MKETEVGQKFLEYFINLGYQLLPSASLMDDSVPMSFVMSAGLVQIELSLAKSQFKGGSKFTLTQKCFRHFDLNKVGTDNFHLSFFEMLGAFEFGETEKASTVHRMWHLATSVLGIDKTRLWATYFGGGYLNENDFPEDSAIKLAWQNLGLPLDHIIGLGIKDNYWIQGKGLEGINGERKCGPNTELFFDRGVDKQCKPDCQPGCSCGRFIEFSNSLFISHKINPTNGKFEKIDDPFIETVIGVERVAMIVQKAESIFEIESFQKLIDSVHGFVTESDIEKSVIIESERVIVDHMKALYFLVSHDAPPPGKNGRNRIVKLLLRGMIIREILLGITSPKFLSFVLTSIAETTGKIYSHTTILERFLEYYSGEYMKFMKTIEYGNQELVKLLRQNKGTTLSGKQILQLEKKHGFPSLLTAKFLHNQGLPFLKVEFEDEIIKWKINAQKDVNLQETRLEMLLSSENDSLERNK